MTAYTSKLLTLPSTSGYRKGDTITLADGSRFELTRAGWAPYLSDSRRRLAARLFSARTQVGNGAGLVYDVPFGGGYVCSVTAEIPVDADGLFVILANGNTGAPLVVNAVSYSCPTDMSLKPFNAYHAANKVAGSFNNGSAGVSIAAAPSASLSTYLMSDLTSISTLPRTDDPTKTTRIVHARVSFAAADNTTPLTYWSRQGTRWTNPSPRGGQMWTTISPGNINANVYGLGQPVDQDGGCLIFGIGYLSRNGKVRVVMIDGDSYVEGTEEGSGSRGFLTEGVIESANLTGVPTEYMNVGWGQTPSSNFMPRALAIMGMYKPSEIIYEAVSPNDGYSSQAAIDGQRQNLMRMLNYCEQNGIRPWVTNGLPNTNAGNTASSLDAAAMSRRQGLIDSLPSYSVPIIDIWSKAYAAGTAGLWVPGATADGVHAKQAWSETNLIPYVAEMLSI